MIRLDREETGQREKEVGVGEITAGDHYKTIQKLGEVLARYGETRIAGHLKRDTVGLSVQKKDHINKEFNARRGVT